MACSAWLFVELLLYGAAFICGIVTAALVTVTQGDFKGGCILYGQGSWNVTGQALGVASFGNSSHCNFVDFVSLLVAIYCFCTIFYFNLPPSAWRRPPGSSSHPNNALVGGQSGHFKPLIPVGEEELTGPWRERHSPDETSAVYPSPVRLPDWRIPSSGFCVRRYRVNGKVCVDRGSRWLTACLVVSVVFLFLLLVCGCLIRVGFSTFCQSVIKEARIKSCSEAEKVKWTPLFHGTSFNQNFSSAETATWVNFFLWVVILSLLAVQWRKGSSVRLLSGTDPEWSTAVAGSPEASGPVSETERLIASQPRP
ncbi:transmembrane protein 179B [Hemitrygon akajei]|uniref:transmembrane protein 179B n=1 Tax=Hemitrygon akajei TaxID=2704970 RepID=UPI003BF9B68E